MPLWVAITLGTVFLGLFITIAVADGIRVAFAVMGITIGVMAVIGGIMWGAYQLTGGN